MPPRQECPGLQCQGGKCIPSNKKCNGVLNCLKGDDELVCKATSFFVERSEKDENRAAVIDEDSPNKINPSNLETSNELSTSTLKSVDYVTVQLGNYSIPQGQNLINNASQPLEKSLIIEIIEDLKDNETFSKSSEYLFSNSSESEIVSNLDSKETTFLEESLTNELPDNNSLSRELVRTSNEKSLLLEFIGSKETNERFPVNVTTFTSTDSDIYEYSASTHEIIEDENFNYQTRPRNKIEEYSIFDVNNTFDKELFKSETFPSDTKSYTETPKNKVLNIEVLTSDEQSAENISLITIKSNYFQNLTAKYYGLPMNASVAKSSNVVKNINIEKLISNKPDRDLLPNLNISDSFDEFVGTVNEEINNTTTDSMKNLGSKKLQEDNDSNEENKESRASTASMEDASHSEQQKNFSEISKLNRNTTDTKSTSDQIGNKTYTVLSAAETSTSAWKSETEYTLSGISTLDSDSNIFEINKSTVEENEILHIGSTKYLPGNDQEDIEVTTGSTFNSGINTLVLHEKGKETTPALTSITVADNNTSEIQENRISNSVTMALNSTLLQDYYPISTEEVKYEVGINSFQEVTEPSTNKLEESITTLNEIEINDRTTELNQIIIKENKKMQTLENASISGTTFTRYDNMNHKELLNESTVTNKTSSKSFSGNLINPTESYTQSMLDSETNIATTTTKKVATDSTQFSKIASLKTTEAPKSISLNLNKSEPFNFNQYTISQTQRMDITELFECAR